MNYQSYFVDLHEPHCFDYYGLVVSLEIRKCGFSVFLFKIALSTQGFLQFYMKFKIGFSSSPARDVGVLLEIVLNL